MPTYIVMITYTDQGIRTIKESPERLARSKHEARAFGCDVKAFYLTMGAPFDIIEIVDAPDDESMARLTLAVASGGNVRTRTARAFSESEFGPLVAALS